MEPQDCGMPQPPGATAQDTSTLHSRLPEEAPEVKTEGYTPGHQSHEGSGDTQDVGVAPAKTNSAGSLNACQEPTFREGQREVGAGSGRMLQELRWEAVESEVGEGRPCPAATFTGRCYPSDGTPYLDPFWIRPLIVDLWDMLRGYFERLKFGDESKDLATTVVERCLKREADLLPLAEKQVRAFAWTVAHNVCHEAWKRAKRWQTLSGSPHEEGKAEEGVGIEHHQYAGQDAMDPENLLGEEEERADERRCWGEVQKRLPKSDLETLLSYIEREDAIERGERRPALQPRERVRIFRAIGRARLLGQEVRWERSCSRAQLDSRANHPRAPRSAPKRPLRGPRKRT